MLPPEVQAMADEFIKRYRVFLENDRDGEQVPELLSAEEHAGTVTRSIGHGMVQTFVNVRAEQAKMNRSSCSCDEIPGVHRTTSWKRETPFGRVSVKDPYVYCRTCGDTNRPVHVLLGTKRETWSPLVEEAAVDLASDESCGKAVAKLTRHHPGVEMGRTTALRMLHEHGRQARAFIDHKLAAAQEVVDLVPALRPKGTKEMEVQFDGGMIPVATLEPIEIEDGQEPELTPVRRLPKRKKVCRWEEAKVGLVQLPPWRSGASLQRSTDIWARKIV